MSLLLETIQCKDGVLQNIEYHNSRMNRSINELFQVNLAIDLSRVISPPEDSLSGIYRCRVVYSTQIESIEFIPYTPRSISSLKIINSSINYRHKFADRRGIDALFAIRGDCDDILIVKDGVLTDTSFSNIALFRDGRWYTPDTPLLHGTKRAKFIDRGELIPSRITAADINSYEKVSLINSMLDPGDITIGVSCIL